MKNLFLAASILAIAASHSTAQTIPSYVPTGGLLGWWPFTGNAGDSSGSGNHGTVNGAALTADRFGNANKAYYFSSVSCGPHIRVNMNNTAAVQGAVSISAWAMRVGAGCTSPRMLEFTNDTSANFNPTAGLAQWVWNNSNITTFGSYTSTTASANSNFTQKPNNTWTHLVYTNDGNLARFYQDGVLINTVASSGQVILGAYAAFGRMNHPGYDAFNGSLDEIGVWNRALKECEVQQLYSASIPAVSVQYSSGILTATGGSFSSYQWYSNGVIIPGATSSTYTPTQNGQYTVVVGQNDCVYQSAPVAVENLAIEVVPATPVGFVLWPNPSDNSVTLTRLDHASVETRFEITDATARRIVAGTWRGVSLQLDVAAWSTGLYLIRCTDAASGETHVLRLNKR